MKTIVCFVLLAVATPVLAQVTIEQAWSRATPPGTTIAAGYMKIENKGRAADRLLAVISPLAARVETHVTMKEGGIMKMRPVEGYEIPAAGSFELTPGGAHLMFVGIKRPFKAGDRMPATLRFEKAGEIKAQFEVRSAAPTHMPMH